jgi:uncharacterized small protein (DUF1192 family)
MKTNIKEVNEHINNLNNEVARLTCSICEKQHDYSYEECLIKESGRSIVGEFKELNNEVERLRGLLKDHATFLRKNGFDRQADDLMRHAPAPEKRATEESSVTVSQDISYAFKDGVKATLTGENNEVAKWFKEPTPDWRELGADEVICEGDELYTTGPIPRWESVPNRMIGWQWSVGDISVRTRRPLPKHTLIRESYDEDWNLKEEMPLEKELDYLTKEASRAADIHNHVLIVDCLRYLRDEIQKLKEALEYKEDRKTPPPSWFKKNKKVLLK